MLVSPENPREPGQIRVYAGLGILTVTLIYVWFISSGQWINWHTTTGFYNLMADGFRHGQVSLVLKPDPKLLALENPYDPNARTGIDYPIDVSLYHGKYYLYFGPLPGLIVAVLGGVFPDGIGDQYLVFAFTLGIFVVQSLLLLKIRQLFFPTLPLWTILFGMLLAGLLGPFTRLLVHPHIYEAALSGGQFFFIAGLYFTILAVSGDPARNVWLFLAGTSFIFSAASRIMQVLPILFMTAMISALLFRRALRYGSMRPLIQPLAALFLPLLLGGAALAWYNWVRFGSIFEFGYYYQLAYNLQSFYHTLFLPAYIPQNLYNYFLNPVTLVGTSPFVNPLPGNKTPIFGFYNLPQPYIIDGYITGLLYGSPFIIFAILPFIVPAAEWLRKGLFPTTLEWKRPGGLYGWMLLSLGGCFTVAAAHLLLFFYAATHFDT